MPPATYAAKKKPAVTHESIIRDVRAGNIKPVYFLMGEESYYIDRLAEFIVGTVLTPEDRDFNLITFFGADTTVEAIINAARSFPMGGGRMVVVVREAQNVAGLDRLEAYLRQPQASTVLVVCHKNGVLDRRKKLASLVESVGVLYESKRLYDRELPAFIRDYLKRKRFAAAPEAVELIAGHVGPDLSRLVGELDKLCIACAGGDAVITLPLVEKHIGVSREFSIFELQDALAQKDVLRVARIADFFERNPKQNPIQKTLPALFRFFSNLMLAYYAPQRDERSVAAWLGLTEWQVKRNVMPALRNYSGVKVMRIISEIRRTDARSKGVDNPSTPSGELMKELLFFILH